MAAWILSDGMEKGIILGCTWVPGLSADQCAFQSELAGIYSIVWMVNCLCSYYSLTLGQIELGCDGL